MTPGTVVSPSVRARTVVLAVAVALSALLVPCTPVSAGRTAAVAAGALQTAPPDTAAETTTPPTVTTPVTTPGTVPDGGGGDDSDVPWPLIIAIGAVAIAVIALIVTAGGRRRRSAPAGSASVPYQASVAQQDRGYALGSAQWVHDHFSLELLSAQPAQAAQRWNADRGRIDDAIIRAQQFGNGPDGITWQRLGQSLALLSTSLDSYVQLRNQDQPNQALIDDAFAVANHHRAELGQQLARLWPTVQR
jgi:hypothetical protein